MPPPVADIFFCWPGFLSENRGRGVCFERDRLYRMVKQDRFPLKKRQEWFNRRCQFVENNRQVIRCLRNLEMLHYEQRKRRLRYQTKKPKTPSSATTLAVGSGTSSGILPLTMSVPLQEMA